MASPGLVTSRELRDVMSDFATGVTVVTTRTAEGEPYGFTANAVASLSLDPPLVLVCVARDRKAHDVMQQAGSYAINILSDRQEDVARRFARAGEDRFRDLIWSGGESGLPWLIDAIGVVECDHHQIHEGGDHAIFTGLVRSARRYSGWPLLFFRGELFGLGRDEGRLTIR
ncbi:MAG: flavin reductase [Chloroflexi bacterium]|nr:flavin reductase [Chloroflexota bacterium]